MGFGDFYFNFRECSGNFARKNGDNGIFGLEMAGINQVQAQIVGVPKLVVFDVCRDKGVAAGVQDFQHSPAQLPPPTATL